MNNTMGMDWCRDSNSGRSSPRTTSCTKQMPTTVRWWRVSCSCKKIRQNVRHNCTVHLDLQYPGETVDGIDNAESWERQFGLQATPEHVSPGKAAT